MTEYVSAPHTEPVVVNYEPNESVTVEVGFAVVDNRAVERPDGKVIEPPVLVRPKGQTQASAKSNRKTAPEASE